MALRFYFHADFSSNDGADIPPRNAPSYRHFSAETDAPWEKKILRAL